MTGTVPGSALCNSTLNVKLNQGKGSKWALSEHIHHIAGRRSNGAAPLQNLCGVGKNAMPTRAPRRKILVAPSSLKIDAYGHLGAGLTTVMKRIVQIGFTSSTCVPNIHSNHPKYPGWRKYLMNIQSNHGAKVVRLSQQEHSVQNVQNIGLLPWICGQKQLHACKCRV